MDPTTTTSTSTTTTSTTTTSTSTTTTTTLPPTTTTTTEGPRRKRSSIPLIFPTSNLDNPDYIVGNNGYINSGYVGSSLGQNLPIPIPEELDEDFSDFSATRIRNYEFWFSNKAMFMTYAGTVIFELNNSGLTIVRNAGGDELVRITSTGNVEILEDLSVGGDLSAEGLALTGDVTAVNGTFTSIAAAEKLFEIPHPSQENMILRHGCLEGPENAVYFRGKFNQQTFSLPSYWKDLVDYSTITIQLTAIGYSSKPLFVCKIEDDRVYVGGNVYDGYYAMVFAERKDIPKLITEIQVET